MFINKRQLMFLYKCIGLMDCGARHLTIIVGTGVGQFANENYLLSQTFDHFFSNAGFWPGGVFAAGIDSQILKHCIIARNKLH